MPQRNANAQWLGGLKSGHGTISFGSFREPFSYDSRFETGVGTNPEELIAAAHAGCFSMALAHVLEQNGHIPESIETSADVSIEQAGAGFKITTIHLTTRARVPGISENEFYRFADIAKETCPVSQALAGAKITLEARLLATTAA